MLGILILHWLYDIWVCIQVYIVSIKILDPDKMVPNEYSKTVYYRI